MLFFVSPCRCPALSLCIYLTAIKITYKYPLQLEANKLACSAPTVTGNKFQMTGPHRHEKQTRRTRAHLQMIMSLTLKCASREEFEPSNGILGGMSHLT